VRRAVAQSLCFLGRQQPDRIFEPYRQLSGLDRETAAALFKHFLVFFNVGDRSWAISQNVIVGGRSISGRT
jgi:formate C-acetyltransferase